MKTTALLSTFAAFFLLITFAETPSLRHTEINKAAMINDLTYIPANLVVVESTTVAERTYAETPKAKIAQEPDFSYLKFDVADYLPENDEATDLVPDNTFDYLKFHASDYVAGESESMEMPASEHGSYAFDVNSYDASAYSDAENMELPANETEYLKFDVNKYISSESVDPENMEMPANVFGYLKFDVNAYTSTTTTDPTEYELPANENSKYKFDVNAYSNTINPVSTDELPADNFSHLKFDANNYSNSNTTATMNSDELPENK
ncbi:MAG: hypothetical protein U0Z17_01950 [Bacteroidales bacterium]